MYSTEIRNDVLEFRVKFMSTGESEKKSDKCSWQLRQTSGHPQLKPIGLIFLGYD